MMLSKLKSSLSSVGSKVKTAALKLKSSMPLMPSILNSRIFLYAILLFTIFTIILFSMQRNLLCIILFTTVAFLTSFFNKNMIVIMSAGLIVSYIVYLTTGAVEGLTVKKGTVEGLVNKEDSESSEEDPKNKGKSLAQLKKRKPSEKDPDPAKEEDLPSAQQIKDLDELKGDYVKFNEDKKNMGENIKDIGPILEKADKLLDKLSSYKEKYSNKGDN